MSRLRLRFTVPALGALAAVGLVAALVTGLAPAAVTRASVKSAPKITTITVTAGKPSELAFKLSKTSMVPAGTIMFKVTNQGVAFHDFRICARPVAGASAVVNSCSGKTTPLLKHGQSATLTVKISKTGKYEFLCAVSGHAQAGMKGLLGVGVSVASGEEASAAKAGTPATTTTSGATTTTKSGGTTTPSGGGGGATTTTSGGGGTDVIDGCPPGKTIQTNGSTDADDDDTGGQTDGDGCI
jgi:uncharacterized cupredoxin-like copper-binding protein